MNGALAGLVILAIGDSHMVNMVTPLHDALEHQGAIVNSYGMCGATATDFLARLTTPCMAERHDKAPALVNAKASPTFVMGDLLRDNRPNLVIIELGDNFAGYGMFPTLPKEDIANQVHQLLRPIAAQGLPCIWVGPPWGTEGGSSRKTFGRVQELSAYLAQIVHPCRYVDSLHFERPGEWPTVDGEHFTQDSYRKWSVSIADSIVRLKSELR
jgi:lysophospholipase L1-like esterase